MTAENSPNETSGEKNAQINRDPSISLEEARNAAEGKSPNASGGSAPSTAEDHIPSSSEPHASDLPSGNQPNP
jgi:hypothetical protein